MLKQLIINFKITKNAIFILIPNKILLFELLTLKYVCTFDDVNLDSRKMSVGLLTSPIILAYPTISNKKLIKISKCNIKHK